MAKQKEVIKQQIKDNEEEIQELFKANEQLRRKINYINLFDLIMTGKQIKELDQYDNIEYLLVNDVKIKCRMFRKWLEEDFEPEKTLKMFYRIFGDFEK